MIDPTSQIGELLEIGQSVTQAPVTDVTKTVRSQVLGQYSKPNPVKTVNNILGGAPSAAAPENTAAREQTEDMVKDLYSPSEAAPQQASTSSDDAQKLVSVRRQLADLHSSTYYDPLFAYEKKKREPTKAEEKEQDERQKLQELAAVSEKNNNDIALNRAKTSIETRVTGE